MISFFDLRELDGDDLDAAEWKYQRAAGQMGRAASGETNAIKWDAIFSRGNIYIIGRFENFWYCECRDFMFSGTGCKHIGFLISESKMSITQKEKNTHEHKSSIGKDGAAGKYRATGSKARQFRDRSAAYVAG